MHASCIFLTGQPGVGKTTIIRQIVRELANNGKRLGGMISSEIRESGERIGFEIEDIATGKSGMLAQKEMRVGAPTVGKYHVNIADIERIGVTAIRNAIREADVVIVDEVGPMELKSEQFILAVEDAIASRKNFVGTVHKGSVHSLIRIVRNANCKIIDVNLRNRNLIAPEIVNELTRAA